MIVTKLTLMTMVNSQDNDDHLAELSLLGLPPPPPPLLFLVLTISPYLPFYFISISWGFCKKIKSRKSGGKKSFLGDFLLFLVGKFPGPRVPVLLLDDLNVFPLLELLELGIRKQLVNLNTN